jgi:diacylglycerol O-acyltransferase
MIGRSPEGRTAVKMLSPNDQMFLWLERRNQPMHIGGLQLLTPPPDAKPGWLYQQAERAKQFAQAQPPFNKQLVRRLGNWFWTEDKEFDIEGHLQVLALPPPGRIRELLAIVSQLHSAPLDRGRPLWEVYLIDGVEGGRVAVYSKIHHALVDGVAANKMLMRMMSEDSQGELVPLWAMEPRKRDGAGEKKSRTELITQALGIVREQASTLPKVVKELYSTLKEARSNPDYVSVFQAPRCILNQRITGSRRFAAQDYSLDRIRAAGKAHNATVNDVVLGMCSSALRRYLADIEALPEKPLIAMVPTSLRRDDSEGGNQVGMILANLATHIDDPIERFGHIKRSMELSKKRLSRMSQAEIVNYLSIIMAPSGINMATGIAPKWGSFNVTISNVPGPKKTLYWNGARLEGMYPVSIVLDGQALNITLTSYVDKLEVGLIACRRTLPHMQRLLDYLEQGLKELEA